jgi:MarR family 2-MHQ and catechol resistance regulon transcriptional repressor
MPPVPAYDPDAAAALGLWVKLSRAFGTFDRIAKRDIARYELTEPQFAVLEALGHLGPMRHCELSRKMLVTGGNTSLVIDNLEKAGLVRRERDPEDRRSVHVHLTPKGEKRFKEIFPMHAEVITAAASVLTTAEQQELSRLLRKLGRLLADTETRNPKSAIPDP